MAQIDDSKQISKEPWVRSAQKMLFRTLKQILAFRGPHVDLFICPLWDYITDTFGEKLHEVQITFHATSPLSLGKEDL